MGRDIASRSFTDADFAAFSERLKSDTETLERWLADGYFCEAHPVGGFELEAWLTDHDFRPAPLNEEVLRHLQDPLLTTELARFNIELNTEPAALCGNTLRTMQTGLDATWQRCRAGVEDLGGHLVTIGILPTVGQADLTRAAMTPIARFKALNDQVLRQRGGEDLQIEIVGHEHLETTHPDVMLESAATSFQVHMQVPASRAADYFNASLLASAPLVAAGANSPFLFGRDLWAETRVPLFEQAVETGGFADAAHGPPRRVGFGSGFLRESLTEYFRESLEHFPVLLPMCFDDEERDRLPHLQLQNGTIWRWNRPLIGFDAAGTPHIRIEHRTLPSGPTGTDALANAALYFGLAHFYAEEPGHAGTILAFPIVRDNFYECARLGLEARAVRSDGRHERIDRMLVDHLLPCARQGLRDLGLDSSDVDHYLGIIEDRVVSGRNGAAWQRAWVGRHGRDMTALTAAYAERQTSGDPVHRWPL